MNDLIPIVGVVFGSIIAIVFIKGLFGLINSWINRNKTSYDDETFDRLARAFIKHKKDMERRMQNIEAIVTDEDPAETSSEALQRSGPKSHREIEIEKDEVKREKLPNMLNKQRSQS